MEDLIIGIDLGTTNSEVAIYENGKAVVLEDGEGKILPSFIGLDDQGELLVGAAARNQYAAYPERTVKSIKRRMGEAVHIELGPNLYSPQELSAILLRRLKDRAEKTLGREVHKAVITVPAYFSDAQRQATREAGEIAGLEVLKIINEPTAASLVYESGVKGERHILVYDLGGGTFDVSVVRANDGVVEVVSSHGNNRLGGDDFDQRLMEHILAHLAEEHGIKDPDLRVRGRIERAAEAAKRQLSAHPFAKIEEEYLLQQDGQPVHLRMEIARNKYEDLILDLVDETIDHVHTALRDAGMAASAIDEILLVGGSTRTPMVRQRLENEFRMTPRGEVDPDLCVACGAAMQAAILGGGDVAAILVDVTPYTFGTSAIGEVHGDLHPFTFVPIIPKNTPIPVSRSEVFYTYHDNQETVQVNVYQGEKPVATDNIQIGEFLVNGLSKCPSGNEIILNFSLDVNGILAVTAMEKKTGLEKTITIDNAISRFEESELDMARSKISRLFGEEEGGDDETGGQDDGLGGALKVEAEAVMAKARAMLDDAGDDDRDDMIELIEAIGEALKQGGKAEVRQAMDELADLIYFLEN